ncbi:MAG TPA: glycosyltransferase 87 family protein [Thermoleophilaceae bacterium]
MHKLKLTVLIAVTALAALLAVRAPLGVDYTGPPATFCDCPATPIRALAHGRVHDFLVTQPVMGGFSLILRAPFAALGLHLGAGSDRDLYRLGVFPCLLAAGLLAVYLFGRLRELRRPALACVLLPGLVALNPLTNVALRYGHPEELLAAALCVGALLAAARGRSLTAGLLLGAAVATKQWALLAVLPALAGAGRQRWRMALAATATAAALIVPMAAGDIHRFFHTNHGAGVITGSAMPTNIWFGFGTDVPVMILPNGATTPPRALPALIGTIAHPLILMAGFALALAWWRLRRGAPREDALLLLALILLVRCLLDPITNGYYHLPFLMALAAWEGLRRRGAPLLTPAAALLIALTSALAKGGITLVQLNAFYLSWALPFAGLLGVLAFRSAREAGVESVHVPREEVLRWAD